MRLYYVVLLALATLVASADASTTANSDMSKITAAEQSDDTTKRFLRTLAENDEAKEERAANLLSVAAKVKGFTVKAGRKIKEELQFLKYALDGALTPQQVANMKGIPFSGPERASHPLNAWLDRYTTYYFKYVK
ncbi:hypothetical protein PHYBOEH_008438 [Phytophthora boehmeriae]|uniref:RxLR effector protein n=1 Tax=Phytophthora boehmeriae TaxID=109152 RepID=A0A8T1W2Y7_9STRA|nr:hypothetical protein PHYBOEH_008438 [Phytophthora boehmeriae]